MTRDELERACEALTRAAGLRGAVRLEPIPGGANNRIFRVEAGDSVAILKSYFRHADDRRDRLGAEFAFSDFAWRHGIRTLPRPLACDVGRGLGLYEFVPGRRLVAGEVDAGCVGQALAFFRDLNRHKGGPDAGSLPDGSEACFSVRDHLDCVGERVRRLGLIGGAAAVDREAADFVRGRLRPAWDALSGSVRQDIEGRREAAGAVLAPGDRCLSASDFGFHNALSGPDGVIRFIDFEYAGWDDPAKLVCDFFCQPEVPVPVEHFEAFADGVVADLPEPRRHRRRIDLLFPLYRIKWCCIVLNDFLPVGRDRRSFASPSDPEGRKVRQLGKARQALRSLTHSVDASP